MLLTMVFFLFCVLLFYEKAIIYYHSAYTADRAAFYWKTGGEQPASAPGDEFEERPLYGDHLKEEILSLFGTAADSSVMLKVPEHANTPGLDGIRQKLQAAAGQLPDETRGFLTYSRRWWERSVGVSLSAFFQMPSFSRDIPGGEQQVRDAAVSRISEPVSFVRNVDLVYGYVQLLKQRAVNGEEAHQAVNRFLQLKAPPTFPTHRQAANYLRQLVGGRETSFPTALGTRVVDALDGDHVIHQAYLTFNEKQLREQMAKDEELLRAGNVVNGVVWHFFRRDNQTGKVGPSEGLRKELESRGIVVVVHD
jgi:hypothetical protein